MAGTKTTRNRHQRVTSKLEDATPKKLIEASGDTIERECSEELVVALCGPIGSPLHSVAETMKKLLSDEFAYTCEVIRLSDFIKRVAPKPLPTSQFQLITTLINQGNEMRRNRGASVLADLAIERIARDRHADLVNAKRRRYKSRRVCYILDSIKNKDELRALQAVYGAAFYCIGVFSPLETREQELAKRMGKANAHTLIARDAGEELFHGQSVRKTFQLADYFLRCTNEASTQLESKLRRFIRLVLDISVISPTIAEMAMSHASLAAMNSACLSRQVGAAIVSNDGRLLSVGWNDVPKFGGDLYRCRTEETPGSDNRCAYWGDAPRCRSFEKRSSAAESAAHCLVNARLIAKSKERCATAKVLKSNVGDIIEFSRSIHAEMHAVLNALASGVRVAGASLYCTTYPCHLCATHLLGAGISKVYYIEPYHKSLAVELHSDAISESERAADALQVLAYDGVAPRNFASFFSAGHERKDRHGRVNDQNPKSARPRRQISLLATPDLERVVIHRLREAKVISSLQPGAHQRAKPKIGSAKG